MQEGQHVGRNTVECFYNSGLYKGCILYVFYCFIIQDKMQYESLYYKQFLLFLLVSVHYLYMVNIAPV